MAGLSHEQLLALQQGADLKVDLPTTPSREKRRDELRQARADRRAQSPTNPDDIPQEVVDYALRSLIRPPFDDDRLSRALLAIFGGPEWLADGAEIGFREYYTVVDQQRGKGGGALYPNAYRAYVPVAKALKTGELSEYPFSRTLLYAITTGYFDPKTPPFDQLWFLRMKVVVREVMWLRREQAAAGSRLLESVIERRPLDPQSEQDLHAQLVGFQQFAPNSLRAAIRRAIDEQSNNQSR